ncbi:hypothetical protein GCM10020221_22690 [Streptomyces thioluteus]|uniref:Uncharacterized protein n=1 Tax=Streptomyces thioluteus TaxID=66431 RepID=A0ABP6J9F8_STRTU
MHHSRILVDGTTVSGRAMVTGYLLGCERRDWGVSALSAALPSVVEQGSTVVAILSFSPRHRGRVPGRRRRGRGGRLVR